MASTRIAVYEQISTTVAANVPHGYGRERLAFDHCPQSSSSWFAEGACGLVFLIQSGERPERYRESLCFETIPSSPSLQACWNTSGPSAAKPFRGRKRRRRMRRQDQGLIYPRLAS